MKSLVLLALFSVPVLAQTNCSKTKNSSKVMLFVDTNNSELEIETASKAACERGERIVIVPKNYKEYGKYTKDYEHAQKVMMNCSAGKSKGAACKDNQQKFMDALTNLNKFKSSQPSIKDGTAEALKAIRESKGKLQNVMISGHDGGGSFGGNKGNFSRFELGELMKDFTDINDVKMVLLLGCYTGVQKEVIEWKSIFPGTKIIAGYDGSAPLSDRPQGHQYITEILSKEKQLLANAEQKRLQSFVKQNIKSIRDLKAGIYLNCDDNKTSQEFYYASNEKAKGFRPFDLKECEKRKGEIEAVVEAMAKFDSGDQEPPKNTASGELRQIYNKARSLEHCIELLGVNLDTNKVFNLLFYEGVKQNFAAYYEKDLEEVEQIISGLNMETFEKNFNDSQRVEEMILEGQEEIYQMYLKDPAKYFALREKEVAGLQAKKDELVKQHPFLANINPESVSFGFSDYTPEQNNIINQYKALYFDIGGKQDQINYEKADANFGMTLLSRVEVKRQQLDSQRQVLESFKADPDRFKKIWVPNSKNLAKKGRKETLENIHYIHKLMSLPGLDPKERQALDWMTKSTSNHLQYFQNPFSWHEYTGHPEKPQTAVSFQDYRNSAYNPYSIGGGFGYGGFMTPIPNGNFGIGSGGGIVGGALGGDSGGLFGF